ncbi:hypothetical protein [Aureimonas psammosilenae]|uniref:hypothetical protein n=1 Tax=Aureimonas psammosilenae TaxID=2495496 RepID=UPI001261032F|nr:hypothetical protein [Aureimonas psammosilenae]
MIRNFVHGILVAATVVGGFAGLGIAPAAAASDIRMVAGGGVRVEPIQYREYRDQYERRGWDRRGDRDRGNFERRDRGCSPRLAVRKAYDLGLNRPRVVREGRNSVVVDGVRRGRLQTVRFANDRGCPVISVRR